MSTTNETNASLFYIEKTKNPENPDEFNITHYDEHNSSIYVSLTGGRITGTLIF